MSNKTKRQHFLPCSYLKFFSHDGNWEDARKTQIYFTDANKSQLTTVNNVGVEKYAYSKEHPEFDKEFHDMEKHYPRIIEKIIGGNSSLNRLDYYGLFMIMSDFNHRNIAYENRTKVERMHVYPAISRSFLADVFAEAKGGGTSKRGILEWMVKYWRINIILPENDEKFITSDNPSTIFSDPKNNQPVMLYLPVHPRFGVIAYDQRFLRLKTTKVSDEVVGILNGLQINRCVRHIFADHDISGDKENWKKLQDIASMPKPKRWIDKMHWNPDYISVASPAFDKLTFIKKQVRLPTVHNAVRQALRSKNQL